MNNRFFADRNDFFKYDLLLEVLEKSGFLVQLTFITMLTPDDGRTGGGLTEYPCGARRADLYEFLMGCLTSNRRNIQELRRFFRNCSFEYTPYRDSQFFEDRARDEYFRNIPNSALQSALVFLDPDNGLEVLSTNSKNADKYVTFKDLRGLLDRIDDQSVLSVFQYLPRQNRDRYIQRMASSLRNGILAEHMIFVSDNRILIMFLGKNIENVKNLNHELESYSNQHGLLLVSYGMGTN